MTAKITIRLPADIHDWLVKVADEDQRSLNSEIVWLLKRSKEQR